MKLLLLLATASGVPALVYEVVWTREVALLVGAQIEAISGVLVAYFGGMALGARTIGPLADRTTRPLRLYAALEIGAGSLAVASSYALRALADAPATGVQGTALLAMACATLLPITVLLGGTLPALVRAATPDPKTTGQSAGWIVGANTLGAVAGVATAVVTIPTLGLRATLLGAGLLSAIVGVCAWGASQRAQPSERRRGETKSDPPLHVLVAAALVGLATLAYEVVATRAAALRLGSSLFAWAAVLGLFLLGLALGNLIAARRAVRASRPGMQLGIVEAGAACAVALTAAVLLPGLAHPASGLGGLSLAVVALSVLPAAVFMGAAFPLLVQLGRPAGGGTATPFAKVSAANTAGGIAGALLASFVLLPELGLARATLACAAVNALVSATFLARSSTSARQAATQVASLVVLLLALAFVPRPEGARGAHVLAVAHGRQASAAVLHLDRHRVLLVDGEPEAATGGDARRTEELLAVLPLLLHPEPERLLEVGFGSGITLATAARFPLLEIDCVEIAPAVLELARFFAPDNRGIHAGGDPRVEIVLADGRAFLARSAGRYDVVVANTLHPWSVGATGLYSLEYFERIRETLRPGGLFVQWLPVEGMGAPTLAAALRTLLEVFPGGSLWWGADNLLVVGRQQPLAAEAELALLRSRVGDPGLAEPLAELGFNDSAFWSERRMASFTALRTMLPPGPLLVDDLPHLERLAARGSQRRTAAAELQLVARIAREGAAEDPTVGPLAIWLESLVARARGDEARAESRGMLAERAGLALARRGRARKLVATAQATLHARGPARAAETARAAVEADPEDPLAHYTLAATLVAQDELAAAVDVLDPLVMQHPGDAEAWNLLGVVRRRQGHPESARQAFDAALRADPFFPEVLANAGLLAVEQGRLPEARDRLAELRAVSPLGTSQQERALDDALARARPR